MEEKLKRNIITNNLIQKGDRIGVAVSGGADSVCLLYFLNKIKDCLEIKEIVAIHVNHSIRGKESDEDEEFVVSLCKKLNIKCVAKRVDAVGYSKENKYTLEQGARILRYDMFNKVANNLKLNGIMLAHHKGDQAETVLMHEFRGCGLAGLTGIKPKTGLYLRPMLDISRENIEKSLINEGLKWRTDSTNIDENYSRNFIRGVIKNVKKVYPAVEDNLSSLTSKMQEISEFINVSTPSHLLKEDNGAVIIPAEVMNYHNVVKRNMIIMALSKLNALVDTEEVHLNGILALFNKRNGAKINLPNGFIVQKDYAGVVIKKITTIKFKSTKFTGEAEIKVPQGQLIIKEVKKCEKTKGKTIVDYDKIPQNAVWRSVEAGDTFTKFGGGTKTVKSYLTDIKMSQCDKENIVVLASCNDILVIPSVEIADSVKIDNNTKKMIEICLKK